MRGSLGPAPSWEGLLSLCRCGKADEALVGCCRRLCAAQGWTRAVVLLADAVESPAEALATCGDVPPDPAAWAAGRRMLPLRCFGRVVAFAYGEPGGEASGLEEGESAAIAAVLALAVAARARPGAAYGPRGSGLLRALDAAVSSPPATIAPLLTRPGPFQLAAQLPAGAVLVAAGGDPLSGGRSWRKAPRPSPSAEGDPLFAALLPLVPGIVLVTEGPEHRIVATNPMARARFPDLFAVGESLVPLLSRCDPAHVDALDDAFHNGVGIERLVLCTRDAGATADPTLWSVAVRPYRRPGADARGLVLVATESTGPRDPAEAGAAPPGVFGDSVFDSCGVALMLISLPELRVVRHNPAMTPLLGGEAARRGGAEGMRIADLVAPETWEQAGPALREALAAGRAVQLDELRAVFAGAPEERYYSWTLAPVSRPEGPTHVIASGVEVTSQVRARNALETRAAAAERRAAGLERALEAATDGVALFDGSGALVWRNAAYARVRAPEPADEQYLTVQVPATGGRRRSSVFGPVGRALLGETVEGETYLMHMEDGGSGAVDVSAWPLPGPEDSVVGALLLLHHRGDERGEARRIAQLIGVATRRSDALAAVIGSLSDGVLITDADGSALLVNRAYCDLFGVEGVPRGLEERMAALDVRDLDGSPAGPADSPVAWALRGQSVVAARQRMRHARGQEIVVEISASPIREAGGHVAGCVCVLRDVTRGQRLMEERDDFISVAAHELRTPLTALLLETQLIERGNARGEISGRWSPHLKRLAASAERLKKLVDGLMDVGRLERGVVTLSKCSCDLSRLAAAAAERFRSLHPDHPLETETVKITAQVDPVRLEQLLDNLLDNAAKYCPPGTPIELTLADEGGQAVLAVADRGHGLPEADLEHVFTRYFRAPQHPARRYTGLGLGLFLARQIAELHGGDISASNRPGGGLRVAVRLPADPDAPGPE